MFCLLRKAIMGDPGKNVWTEGSGKPYGEKELWMLKKLKSTKCVMESGEVRSWSWRGCQGCRRR